MIEMPIFKKMICKKGESWDAVIRMIKDAGWEDISSDSETDYCVMHSTGMNHDNNIYIQMKNFAADVNQTIKKSTSALFSMRMLKGYTPGEPGEKGVCIRDRADEWMAGYICSMGIEPYINGIEITYYVDKNMACFLFRPPTHLMASHARTYFYFGIPRDGRGDFVGSRETMLMTCGWYGQAINHAPYLNNNVFIIDSPTGTTNLASAGYIGTYINKPQKQPDWKGRYKFERIFYGEAGYGTRGEVYGIYAVPPGGNAVDRDMITDIDTGYKYEIFCPSPEYHSLSGYYIAYRIE